MGKTLALIGGGVLVAVVLSVATMWLLGSRSAARASAPAVEPTPALSVDLKPLSLDTFTTNLSGTPNHFIQVTFELLPKDDKTSQRLAGAKPLLRDAVLNILRTRTMEDVNGASGMEKLATAVQESVNAIAGPGSVTRVLVTDLVVQ